MESSIKTEDLPPSLTSALRVHEHVEMPNAGLSKDHPQEDICQYISPSDNLIGVNLGNFRNIVEEVLNVSQKSPLIAFPNGREMSKQGGLSEDDIFEAPSSLPRTTLCILTDMTDFSFKARHLNTSFSRKNGPQVLSTGRNFLF